MNRRPKGPLARQPLIAAAILGALGLVALILFATVVDPHLAVIASAILFAGASFAVGGVIGFLFGVPRTLTSDAGPDERAASRIRPNTNLEQVSDWLTKLLIGATLVELRNIPSGAARLFEAMAPALGAEDVSAAFAGGLVVYFAALGFLAGWLITRLSLGKAMRQADMFESLISEAKEARMRGEHPPSRELLDKAAELLYGIRT